MGWDVEVGHCDVEDVNCNVEDVNCDVEDVHCDVEDVHCDVEDVMREAIGADVALVNPKPVQIKHNSHNYIL